MFYICAIGNVSHVTAVAMFHAIGGRTR